MKVILVLIKVLEILNRFRVTFPQSEESLISDDFKETISDAIVVDGSFDLSLHSDFDDIEWLHHKDHCPS